MGTGTYVSLSGSTRVLTAHHVAAIGSCRPLVVNPGDGLEPMQITSVWTGGDVGTGFVDAAFASLAVDQQSFSKQVLEPHAFSDHPQLERPLFVLGYPLAVRRGGFGAVVPRAVPVWRRPAEAPPEFDATDYFTITWREEELPTLEGGYASVPHAGGMSGALVWDPQWTGSLEGWSSDGAHVVGMVIRCNEQQGHLVCMNGRMLRKHLLNCLRHEAAYLRWLDRGRPQGTALDDWLWAEQRVVSLESGVQPDE